MNGTRHREVGEYLRRLQRSMADLPAERRDEILAEIEAVALLFPEQGQHAVLERPPSHLGQQPVLTSYHVRHSTWRGGGLSRGGHPRPSVTSEGLPSVQTRFLGTLVRSVVLAAEPCRLVQIGFPGAGFRRLWSDLVLMRLLPAGAIPGAAPERPSGRRPTWT